MTTSRGTAQSPRTITVRSIVQAQNETLLHLAAPKWHGCGLSANLDDADRYCGKTAQARFDSVLSLSTTLHAVYRSRKYLSAKVRTFIDFLASQNPAGAAV